MEIKNIYLTLDFLFSLISGFTFIELMPLLFTGNGILVFSELDNVIKFAGALASFIYFGIRIYFYFHKSKAELLYLKQQTLDLELKNKNCEINNFVFNNFIEYEEKKEQERIKTLKENQ